MTDPQNLPHIDSGSSAVATSGQTKLRVTPAGGGTGRSLKCYGGDGDGAKHESEKLDFDSAWLCPASWLAPGWLLLSDRLVPGG